MNESTIAPKVRDLYERLRRRSDLRDLSDGQLATAALRRLEAGGSSDLSGEEEVAKGLLATNPLAPQDVIGAIVAREFEGATQDIALRHLTAVRHERTRRLISGILGALGGEGATMVDILEGTGRAVADAVVGGASGVSCSASERRRAAKTNVTDGGSGESGREVAGELLRARAALVPMDAAATAQLAHAVSQAIQQVSVNIQKIVTVALDAERAGDAENPRYSSP